MSLLRLSRLSDVAPPARELLQVEDDGSISGWRSQGPAVGRFAGTAPDPDRVRAAVAAVAGVAPPDLRLPLDATVDTIDAVGGRLRVSAAERPGDPWGSLAEVARSLLDDVLPTFPVAAITLVVAGDVVRLEHRGRDALPLELGAGWAEATCWRDDIPVGTAEAGDLGGLGRVEAGPGWTATIPLHAPAARGGDLLTASAWFVADDGGVLVPVVVTGRLAVP